MPDLNPTACSSLEGYTNPETQKPETLNPKPETLHANCVGYCRFLGSQVVLKVALEVAAACHPPNKRLPREPSARVAGLGFGVWGLGFRVSAWA